MIDKNLAYWLDMFPDIKETVTNMDDTITKQKIDIANLRAENEKLKQQLSLDQINESRLKQNLQNMQTELNAKKNYTVELELSSEQIWNYWREYISKRLPEYIPPSISGNVEQPYINAVTSQKEIKNFAQLLKQKLKQKHQYDKRLDDLDAISQTMRDISFTKM